MRDLPDQLFDDSVAEGIEVLRNNDKRVRAAEAIIERDHARLAVVTDEIERGNAVVVAGDSFAMR